MPKAKACGKKTARSSTAFPAKGIFVVEFGVNLWKFEGNRGLEGKVP